MKRYKRIVSLVMCLAMSIVATTVPALAVGQNNTNEKISPRGTVTYTARVTDTDAVLFTDSNWFSSDNHASVQIINSEGPKELYCSLQYQDPITLQWNTVDQGKISQGSGSLGGTIIGGATVRVAGRLLSGAAGNCTFSLTMTH